MFKSGCLIYVKSELLAIFRERLSNVLWIVITSNMTLLIVNAE